MSARTTLREKPRAPRRHPMSSKGVGRWPEARLCALQVIGEDLAGLTWSPRLLRVLLDELHVDDVYDDIVGPPDRTPRDRYAEAVTVALILRHSWRLDDLARCLKRLGLPTLSNLSKNRPFPGTAEPDRRRPPEGRRLPDL
jgi:hypothetical protein